MENTLEIPIVIKEEKKRKTGMSRKVEFLADLITSPRKQIRLLQKADSSYLLFLVMATLVVWGHVNFLPFLFKTVFPEWTQQMALSRAWGLSLFLEGLIFIFAVKKVNIKFAGLNVNEILKYSAFAISFFGFIFELVTKWGQMNFWQFILSFFLLFITAIIPTLAMLGFAMDLKRLARKKKTTKSNIPFKENLELQRNISDFVTNNLNVKTISGVFENFKTQVGETTLRNFLKENFADRFGKNAVK